MTETDTSARLDIGMPVREYGGPEPESRQGDTPPVWRAPQVRSRMPADRSRVPLKPSRTRSGRLDDAIREAEEQQQRRGDFRSEVVRDAGDGQIVRHRDGRPVQMRTFVPWTDDEYDERRRQVRGFHHAVDQAGEVSLQHESHRLGESEDRIAAEIESITQAALDLRDEMKYGRISAADAGARLEDLRRRQERIEDLRTEHLAAVERFEARRERGGYEHHMDLLRRFPAIHEGVVTALRTGQVPEVHNPYGHYDELDSLRKVESPVYKSRKLIEDELDVLHAKLHARDQRRAGVLTETERQVRDKYPPFRDR